MRMTQPRTREAMLVLLLMLVMSVLLAAVPAHSFEVPVPDAALVGQSLAFDGSSGVVEAASWIVIEPKALQHRRVWFDVFDLQKIDNFEDVGYGGSMDVMPGQPFAAGLGYQDGVFLYGGAHIQW